MNKAPITIVTGCSGSGKSTAPAAFEDSGHYCVDNMPVALLPRFLELSFDSAEAHRGFVFGMDLRDRGFIRNHETIFDQLRRNGYHLQVIFLQADEKILVRRYSQTRRRHPLTTGKSVQAAIREETTLLNELRGRADRIIDTSNLNVHELKAIVRKLAHDDPRYGPMHIEVISFGFKYGLPIHADLVMDVRFLKNPYFEKPLRPLSGENQKIRDFVLNNDGTCLFLQRYIDLLDILIPQYEDEGKSYLTIAIGCTGGRHRSVVIATEIYDHVTTSGRIAELTHRDIEQHLAV